MSTNNFYRADIDGLRAIAVVSVIIYHIESSLLPGGFLGVDIFFVISGFLITGLLLKELQKTEKLNLQAFYVRRVKRILPALLTVILSTLIVGFLIFTPADYFSLLKSAIASLLSLANVFFYFNLDQGYFAKDTAEVPLLHMWSLAVEEQFYLIWPLLMTFIYKKKGFTFLFYTLLIILIFSLTLAQTSLKFDQPFAYYSLPTRAWELAAGAALWMARAPALFDHALPPLAGFVAALFFLGQAGWISTEYLRLVPNAEVPVEPSTLPYWALIGFAAFLSLVAFWRMRAASYEGNNRNYEPQLWALAGAVTAPLAFFIFEFG